MPTPFDRAERRRASRLLVVALVSLLAACGDAAGPAAGIGPTRPEFGKTMTSDPIVSSTSPDTGQQGTTLDVQINGGNFTTGAVATWALQGVVDTSQVKTLATKYVNSRTLIATIAIGPNATLASWDVQVALSNGKNGVGSDLFTIKARNTSDASATFYVSSDASYLLHGDAAPGFVEGSSSPFAGSTRYADSECGVSATIFTSSGKTGDGHLMTSGPQQVRKCSAYPRTLHLVFAAINADGTTVADGSETVSGAINVHALEQTLSTGAPGSYIPVGTSQLRVMHIGDGVGAKCDDGTDSRGLAFHLVLNTGVLTGADDVVVHRNSTDTWTVTTMPDEIDPVTGQTIHHDKAYCRGNGQLYHMPLNFVIKSSVALTP
jgi:hypothetical protein